MGLIRTAETIATIAFAFPAVLIGVEELLAGRQIGWVFLALAAVAFGVNHFVSTPSDWVDSAAGKVLGKAAKMPDEEE